jgi:hypothetical protein
MTTGSLLRKCPKPHKRRHCMLQRALRDPTRLYTLNKSSHFSCWIWLGGESPRNGQAAAAYPKQVSTEARKMDMLDKLMNVPGAWRFISVITRPTLLNARPFGPHPFQESYTAMHFSAWSCRSKSI